MVKMILRLEGLFVFAASLFLFNEISGNWLLFVLLILVPDLSMIGYLRNTKLGSITYNLVHNYLLALAVIFLGLGFGNNFVVTLGLILSAHIGMDRFFGYGLKYPDNFKNTHIQKL